MCRLGLLLLEDVREALDWLLKSAERGNSEGQLELGRLVRGPDAGFRAPDDTLPRKRLR